MELMDDGGNNMVGRRRQMENGMLLVAGRVKVKCREMNHVVSCERFSAKNLLRRHPPLSINTNKASESRIHRHKRRHLP